MNSTKVLIVCLVVAMVSLWAAQAGYGQFWSWVAYGCTIIGGVTGFAYAIIWFSNYKSYKDRIMGVPARLANELIKSGDTYAGDLLGQRLRLAYVVIHYYLGEQWFNDKVCLQDSFDPFMLNEHDEKGENRWMFQYRVEGLADALFELRNCKNFDVLCDRFRNGDAKSCHAEAKTASVFAKDGFEVEVVRLTGKRGEDFDFVARKASQEISVEVTAKEDAALTVKTIANTLRKKRGQVPADRAAILYVIIPEEWTEDGPTADSVFSEAIGNHFRNSKTFNAVSLVWVNKIVLGEGRAFALAYHPFEHPSPRHPIGDMSFLRPDHPRGDLNTLRGRVKTDSEGLERELEGGHGEPPPSYLEWYLLASKTDNEHS